MWREVHAHGLAVHPSASQPSLGGLDRAGRPLCKKQSPRPCQTTRWLRRSGPTRQTGIVQTAGPPGRIGLLSTWGSSSASSVQVRGGPQAQMEMRGPGAAGLGAGRSVLCYMAFVFYLTGQHRALGSGISKVQSLKLDTSVWSNEIVQVKNLGKEWGEEWTESFQKSTLGPA